MRLLIFILFLGTSYARELPTFILYQLESAENPLSVREAATDGLRPYLKQTEILERLLLQLKEPETPQEIKNRIIQTISLVGDLESVQKSLVEIYYDSEQDQEVRAMALKGLYRGANTQRFINRDLIAILRNISSPIWAKEAAAFALSRPMIKKESTDALISCFYSETEPALKQRCLASLFMVAEDPVIFSQLKNILYSPQYNWEIKEVAFSLIKKLNLFGDHHHSFLRDLVVQGVDEKIKVLALSSFQAKWSEAELKNLHQWVHPITQNVMSPF